MSPPSAIHTGTGKYRQLPAGIPRPLTPLIENLIATFERLSLIKTMVGRTTRSSVPSGSSRKTRDSARASRAQVGKLLYRIDWKCPICGKVVARGHGGPDRHYATHKKHKRAQKVHRHRSESYHAPEMSENGDVGMDDQNIIDDTLDATREYEEPSRGEGACYKLIKLASPLISRRTHGTRPSGDAR
jgi:hypothetical protein